MKAAPFRHGIVVDCDFGAVDAARRSSFLTWSDLARLAGLSETTLYRMRHQGKVRVSTLDRVATACGVDLHLLLAGAGQGGVD